MKNKDLLIILGEIDEELVEDAAPVAAKDRVKIVKKKRRSGWIKPAAIAACCALILCGAMMAQPLFDRFNSPNIVDTDKEDEGQGEPIESQEEKPVDPPHVEGDINQDAEFEPAETEEAQPEWSEDEDYKGYRSITIVGEEYNGYSLTYRICDASAVGKKIDTIEVNHFWSKAPSDVTVLIAEIFEVVGIDGELSYCYKYVDTYGLFDGWFIEESNYYFLNKHNYSFDSLENMYEKLNMHEYANISDSVRFSQSGKSYDTYCHNFMLYGEAEEQFIKMLLSVKGVGLGSDEGLRNTLQFSANKKIEFSIEISNSDKHHFYVLDNGYILCIAYGSSAFDIGEDAANALIEFIEKNAEPQGYEWYEEESIWVKDEVETDDVGNAVSDFAGVLESVGEVKLDKTVRYRETVIGFAPSHFTLNSDMLEAICEVLYICNGTPVYDKDIDGEADECVILANTGKYTVGFAVYSNGYIGVNGIYYEVGTELTQKIINVVKTEGKAPGNMFWNEKEECWQTYGPEDEGYIEKDPAESVDRGYGEDVYEDDEIVSETCIESIREEDY